MVTVMRVHTSDTERDQLVTVETDDVDAAWLRTLADGCELDAERGQFWARTPVPGSDWERREWEALARRNNFG